MRRWIKLWWERIIGDSDFALLSIEARMTYVYCYAGAGFCDAAGRLARKGDVMTPEMIALWTHIGIKKQRQALADLITKGFLIQNLDGSYEIPKWEVLQETPAAQRMRTQRNSYALNNEEAAESGRNGSSQDEQTTLRSVHSVHSTPSATAPTWVGPLRNEVQELIDAGIDLRSLTVEQRFVLGRFHALRFGNCTNSESKNRTRGSQVAAGVATLANSKPHGDLTIGQYVAAGDIVHTQRNKMPWFDPWLIKAVLEVSQ